MSTLVLLLPPRLQASGKDICEFSFLVPHSKKLITSGMLQPRYRIKQGLVSDTHHQATMEMRTILTNKETRHQAIMELTIPTNQGMYRQTTMELIILTSSQETHRMVSISHIMWQLQAAILSTHHHTWDLDNLHNLTDTHRHHTLRDNKKSESS